MSEKAIHLQTNFNVQEKSSLIWNIADILRGLYKPHEYGEVILPMTVIKRFHDTLLPTRDAVMEAFDKYETFAVKEGFLQRASGHIFYNTSHYTFDTLLSDSEHIEENFRAYLNGFSENVQDVLTNFEMDRHITKLGKSGKLFHVIQEFNTAKGYMGADTITSTDMGYVFEDLVKRFSESYNEEAGAHFTSRDIIYLMTDILLSEEKDILMEEGVVKTVYDQAMGTSQMLGAMEERLKLLDADAEVTAFGQELNSQTYAIAKADMIIKGGNPENMKQGNTLTEDHFEGYTFDYCISNPPFGIDWKSERIAVKKEHDLGDNGRFGIGLPGVGDGQLLFMLNGIKKLKDTGKMAIIHNGSALFTGAAGSGVSEIRRYIIESDWLDAIVQLPGDSFYNTGISTYIWIISKDKPSHRRGKVQLIDASNMFEKRRKAIGDKRNDITQDCREIIIQAYGDFLNKEYTLEEKTLESIIMNNEDFGFNRVTVESPLIDENRNIIMNKNKPRPDPSLRDTEDIPLTEDIETYFEREVKPFNPQAWIDKTKTKVGYEIPFTRLFYKYEKPERTEEIILRIKELEEGIVKSFEALSGQEVKTNG
ncbi:class I SAM-dependent DNA methyltransferase [Sporosarcina sp. FSL K6-6792]|uniref:type I restriction-modification system subunit M n=1 Tax=Sporosarcina sp. FSL K6-6792 TaxID=2921559 RepID=UPI0030F7E448